MRILVTGGAGFIGSHIVDRYIQNDHEVYIVDDLSTGSIDNINKDAFFYKVDIRDRTALEKIIVENQIQVINHHAAQLDVRISVADPIFDAGINLIGLITLLEVFRKSPAEKKKFIFISSGGCIYGDTNCPVSENAPIKPESPYGASKASGEYYLGVYRSTYDMDYTILRYSNVYGPRQDPRGEAGVVAIFIGNLLQGKKCRIYGDGEQLRDYVFVGDVVNANVLALVKGSGQAFNIGTGVASSVNKLYADVTETMDIQNGSPEYRPERAGELLKNYLDNTKAREMLGWIPSVTLKEGLEATIKYFEKRSVN